MTLDTINEALDGIREWLKKYAGRIKINGSQDEDDFELIAIWEGMLKFYRENGGEFPKNRDPHHYLCKPHLRRNSRGELELVNPPKLNDPFPRNRNESNDRDDDKLERESGEKDGMKEECGFEEIQSKESNQDKESRLTNASTTECPIQLPTTSRQFSESPTPFPSKFSSLPTEILNQIFTYYFHSTRRAWPRFKLLTLSKHLFPIILRAAVRHPATVRSENMVGFHVFLRTHVARVGTTHRTVAENMEEEQEEEGKQTVVYGAATYVRELTLDITDSTRYITDPIVLAQIFLLCPRIEKINFVRSSKWITKAREVRMALERCEELREIGLIDWEWDDKGAWELEDDRLEGFSRGFDKESTGTDMSWFARDRRIGCFAELSHPSTHFIRKLRLLDWVFMLFGNSKKLSGRIEILDLRHFESGIEGTTVEPNHLSVSHEPSKMKGLRDVLLFPRGDLDEGVMRQGNGLWMGLRDIKKHGLDKSELDDVPKATEWLSSALFEIFKKDEIQPWGRVEDSPYPQLRTLEINTKLIRGKDLYSFLQFYSWTLVNITLFGSSGGSEELCDQPEVSYEANDTFTDGLGCKTPAEERRMLFCFLFQGMKKLKKLHLQGLYPPIEAASFQSLITNTEQSSIQHLIFEDLGHQKVPDLLADLLEPTWIFRDFRRLDFLERQSKSEWLLTPPSSPTGRDSKSDDWEAYKIVYPKEERESLRAFWEGREAMKQVGRDRLKLICEKRGIVYVWGLSK